MPPDLADSFADLSSDSASVCFTRVSLGSARVSVAAILPCGAWALSRAEVLFEACVCTVVEPSFFLVAGAALLLDDSASRAAADRPVPSVRPFLLVRADAGPSGDSAGATALGDRFVVESTGAFFLFSGPGPLRRVAPALSSVATGFRAVLAAALVPGPVRPSEVAVDALALLDSLAAADCLAPPESLAPPDLLALPGCLATPETLVLPDCLAAPAFGVPPECLETPDGFALALDPRASLDAAVSLDVVVSLELRDPLEAPTTRLARETVADPRGDAPEPDAFVADFFAVRKTFEDFEAAPDPALAGTLPVAVRTGWPFALLEPAVLRPVARTGVTCHSIRVGRTAQRCPSSCAPTDPSPPVARRWATLASRHAAGNSGRATARIPTFFPDLPPDSRQANRVARCSTTR